MIRLIKRQQGLPFLFALGVMFILSASFLAVQLWSDNEEFRGAAAALEAPLIPPDLNAPTIVPPPRETNMPAKKNVAGNKAPKESAVPVEAADEEPSVEANVPKASEEVIEIPQKQVPVKVAKVEKTGAIKLEKPENIKERPVQKPIAPAQKTVANKPVIKEAREVPQVEAEPAAKKADSEMAMPEKNEAEAHAAEKRADSAAENHSKAIKEQAAPKKTAPVKDLSLAEAPVEKPIVPVVKAVKKAKSVEIPTEVPPEWNWFQTPLRLEMTDGKVEIVSDKASNNPSRIDDANSGKIEMKSSPRAPKRHKVVSEGREKVVVASEKAQEKFAEKPFVKALGKMAKLKERRLAAGSSPVTKTSSPVVVREAVMALKRLQDMVRFIGRRAGPIASIESEEVVEAARADGEEDAANSIGSVANDEIASEQGSQSVLNSSYRGSGSSFSMRVNELIRSGAWLRD